MKLLLKLFTLSVMQVMMMFTLTFAPIPFFDRINLVYAQDDSSSEERDCEDNENPDGTPGVYRPGCDFNDALTKATDEAPTQGFVGIIEQYLAAGFALAAINSVAFIQHPMAQIDCPGYKTPDVTLRLMQAGSLSYIIGNIHANIKFKKAAKEAADNAFMVKTKQNENVEDEEQAQANAQENSDQLAAYDALLSVYEAKASTLETKQTMSLIAELGYIGALGFEVGMTSKEAARCTQSDLQDLLNETKIKSALTAAKTAAAGICSSPDITGATKAMCCDCVPTAAVKLAAESADAVATAATRATMMSKKITTATADQGLMAKLFASFVSIFTLGVAGFFLQVQTPEPAEARDAADKALAAAVSNNKQVSFSTAQGKTLTLIPSCGKCPTATASVTIVKESEIAKTYPIMCCGTRQVEPMNGGWVAHIPSPGKIWIEKDVIIPPIIIGSTARELDFIKKIAGSFLLQYNLDFIEKQNLDHVTLLKRYRQAIEEVDYFEHNFYSIIQSPQFKHELAQIDGMIQKDGKDFATLAKRLKESLIPSAYAGGFGELMGFGIKMLALQFAFGNFMRDTALVTPKNRAYMYGAMAAVNAGLMIFNGKSRDEAQNRYDIVMREKQNFAASRPELTKAVNAAGESGSLSLQKLELSAADLAKQNIVGCADPKGSNFVPAVCPSKIRRGNLNIPLNQETSRRFNNSPLGQVVPLLSDIGYQTASGQSLMNSKALDGKLNASKKISNALRKQVDKLVKDFENGPEKQMREKFGLKTEPLSKSNLRFRKMFQGDPNKTGVTKEQLANLQGSLAKIKVPDVKKLGKGAKVAANKPVYTTPSFDMPKAPDFNFDMGSDSSSSTDVMADANEPAADMADFEYKREDINQRSDVNLFKLISNRYLRSYPVLLKEDKK